MDLYTHINAFEALGIYINNIASDYENFLKNNKVSNEASQLLEIAKQHNGWFTSENILLALRNWSEALSKANLLQWTSAYQFPDKSPKTVAIIMAGNIPLVGFHDFLSVLISGNKALVKQSSNDAVLLPFLSEFLIKYEPEFRNRIHFSDANLKDFDAVIATGSNNTARHFAYYFGKYPNIIRHNRNSVAILTGNETLEELKNLCRDIFTYFGLGCRNVSKIYVPKNYDFELFFKACYEWKEIIHNHKYINNYDYNKAVYLMDNLPLLDNEFLILKEDSQLSSPIAVLFYEYYDSLPQLRRHLQTISEDIQCVVSSNLDSGDVHFGETQKPKLWDYADNVDTLAFLLQLS